MSDNYDPRVMRSQPTHRAGIDDAAMDEGLRTYMLKIYNYMASGILLTGIVAMVVASSPTMLNAIFGSGLGIVFMLAPFGFIIAINMGLQKFRLSTLQMLFWAFAGVMGLSMASIFVVYTGESVAQTFFVTAAAFGALSLYGYTTKKDLSAWGKFLFMAVVGLIIASVVNLFMQSGPMQLMISGAGVLIFSALTAYDTQRLKMMYYELNSEDMANRVVIMGALKLYLDFINLFLFLLRFMGNRN
jgi:uncharacterized protein